MTSETQTARRYAVVSGKGGVGKTVIAANLAAALAALGRRTLVIDADLGLANLDIILGVNCRLSLHDIIRGTARSREVIVHTSFGFDLLPAGSGLVEGTQLTPALATGIEEILESLEPEYDVVLFDAGAGIGEVVLFFARLAHEVLLVVTPEPTSIMDVYATIKTMALLRHTTSFGLIVNLADPSRPDQAGSSVARHLQKVVTRFLSDSGGAPLQLNHLGSVPRDPAVPLAVSRQQLLLQADPLTPAGRSILRLAPALFSNKFPCPAL